MKIVIFGSTGKTGQQLVHQALDRGHTVIAAARSPQKMTLTHDNLAVVQCDVLQPQTLPAALAGAEAVFVSIGGDGLGDPETRSVGTKNILSAMHDHGVDRILVVSTAGVGDSIKQLSVAGKTFVNTVIRTAVADHARQEAAVQQSGLRWTIGRPGGLSNAGRTDTYRADPDGNIRIGQISRADVAHFLLEALDDPDTEGKVYALSA